MVGRALHLLVLAPLVLSCGGKDPAPTAVPDGADATPSPDEPAAEPEAEPAPAPETATVEFAGWKEWTRVNEERFESGGHNKAFVDVYVESQHADLYRGKEAAPVGMRVVKAQYQNVDDADPVRLTVMAKMDPGYDSERGDWYYGVFAPDGTTFKQQGKMESCSGCHTGAAGTDYLFRK